MTTHKQVRSTVEALTLALEALESLKTHPNIEVWSTEADEAITAIKEALMSQSDGAQPAVAEQHKQSTTCGEPVACEHKVQSVDPATGNGHCLKCFARGKMRFIVDEAPQRKPLTDERFELIGHADLAINNIYVFNGYGEEVPEGRTPIYAGYKAAHGITSKGLQGESNE